MFQKYKKSIGQSIDELIKALKDLDPSSRELAIKTACEHLKIETDLEFLTKHEDIVSSIDEQTKLVEKPKERKVEGEIKDIRTLKETKKPSSNIEMACVMAYYLEQHAPSNESREFCTPQDIKKYFKQAGYPVPEAYKQVLLDAKAAGYFDSPSRGKFKLNPVGYNLVAHSLPRKGLQK